MARSTFSRAAMVIRSLLRDNLLVDHVVTPEGERGIVASEVVAELETADEAGEVVPVRDTAVQMAEVRARVTGNPVEGPTADRPADTGDVVASLAGRYANFTADDFMAVEGRQLSDIDQFCADVRSMAASLLRQNERAD